MSWFLHVLTPDDATTEKLPGEGLIGQEIASQDLEDLFLQHGCELWKHIHHSDNWDESFEDATALLELAKNAKRIANTLGQDELADIDDELNALMNALSAARELGQPVALVVL